MNWMRRRRNRPTENDVKSSVFPSVFSYIKVVHFRLVFLFKVRFLQSAEAPELPFSECDRLFSEASLGRSLAHLPKFPETRRKEKPALSPARQIPFGEKFSEDMYKILSLVLFVTLASAELTGPVKRLDWLVGKWRSEFSGKVFWPTVPTMTYGEELIVREAPLAKSVGVQFLNFSARAWSHSTKDHFHDEWGFLTVDNTGNATLMTAGNNGFTTYEVGPVSFGHLVLELKDIGRISFSRDLPVEALRRTFIRHDDFYMEQILEMRTATHPRTGMLEHTRVIYQKVKEDKNRF